jgi:hypothetical protein
VFLADFPFLKERNWPMAFPCRVCLYACMHVCTRTFVYMPVAHPILNQLINLGKI